MGTTNNLYRVQIAPALVADGPALASVMPYLVKNLTDMALTDGHRTLQLKWHSMYAPPDVMHDWPAEYWLCARVLPIVRPP